jgi:hypothetical protein
MYSNGNHPSWTESGTASGPGSLAAEDPAFPSGMEEEDAEMKPSVEELRRAEGGGLPVSETGVGIALAKGDGSGVEGAVAVVSAVLGV